MDPAVRGHEACLETPWRPTSSGGLGLWQQGGSGNVKVIVRVKPSEDAAAQGTLHVHGDNIKLLAPKPLDFEGFSWVAGPQSSQDDIMMRVGQPMVESLRSGFNSTILAYGDSGSGKTHTMIGPAGSIGDAEEGLIPRVLKSLFCQLTADYGPAMADPTASATTSANASCAPSECGDAACADDCASSVSGIEGVAGRVTWSAEMAFLQVYKEAEITNLLSSGYAETSTSGPKRMRLAPVLDPGVKKLPREVVAFLRRKQAMVAVATADEAMARLQQGAKLRRTCATVNNAESSRSHAVFVLELAIRTPRPDGSWLEQNPRLVMMDLAGSESFESSSNTAETASINTGLLYLGNVLRELAEAGERGGGGKGGGAGLINFNNHNLTRFLEHSMDSRGRGGKVALIVAVRPTPPERLPHSLHFAKKALSIKITAAKNEHLHAKDMAKLVERLQSRVQELEIELQRRADRQCDALEADRRELRRLFSEQAAALEAEAAAAADVLRRRGDDAVRALEEQREASRAGEARVADMKALLAAARDELGAAAAAREAERRARGEEVAELAQRLRRAEADKEAAESRWREEAGALREELRQERDHGARDAAVGAAAAEAAAKCHESELQRAAEAHAAELARGEARRAEDAAAARAAAEAVAVAHLQAMAEAEALGAARLRDQAAQLKSLYAERLAGAEAAAAAAATATREAHAMEVQRLVAQLARAQDEIAAAEERSKVQEAETAARAAETQRQLQAACAERDTARAALRMLRRDSLLRRESLLRAKAVVAEVREDGTPRGVTASAAVCPIARGSASAAAAARLTPRRSLENAIPLLLDGAAACDGEGSGAAAPPEAEQAACRSSRDDGGRAAGANAGADAADPSAADQSPRRSVSPVTWLRQTVASPQAMRGQTPAEKARMLRQVISSMKWEAAGLMSEQRSSGELGPSPGRDEGGDGGSSGGRGGGGCTVGQSGSKSSADGCESGSSSSSSDFEDAGRYSHRRARRLFSASRNAISQLNGHDGSAAPLGTAPQQKRRRQLQPPQDLALSATGPAGALGPRSRPTSANSQRRLGGHRRAAAGGWPEEYEPEAASREAKAALDRAVLDDLAARRRARHQRRPVGSGKGEGDGESPGSPPLQKVTVELLVGVLQGAKLRGAEWRRGGKKRHELVADYLAWAAAHPPAAEAASGADAQARRSGGSVDSRCCSAAGRQQGAGWEGFPGDAACDATAEVQVTQRQDKRQPGPTHPVPQASSSSPPPPQQQQQQQQQAPIPSPAMALASRYADTPPPTKLLAGRHQQLHHGPLAPGSALSADADVCLQCVGLAPGATGYKGVTLDDIFAEGSRSFCNGQLPVKGRRG